MAGRSLPWGRSCRRQASRCFRAPAARAQLFVVHWYPALKTRSMVASVALFGNESSRTCSDFNFTRGALRPRNDSSPRLKKRVVFVSAIKADIADVGVGPRIPSGRHRRKGKKITLLHSHHRHPYHIYCRIVHIRRRVDYASFPHQSRSFGHTRYDRPVRPVRTVGLHPGSAQLRNRQYHKTTTKNRNV